SNMRKQLICSQAGCTLQALLKSKEKQYALACEHGLPSPRWTYIETLDELEEFSRDARFPALLKPRSHREWVALPKDHPLHGKKTASSNSREELFALYRSVRELVPHAVAQEEIVGPDSA